MFKGKAECIEHASAMLGFCQHYSSLLAKDLAFIINSKSNFHSFLFYIFLLLMQLRKFTSLKDQP
jgi:hypothetical protein